MKITTDWHVHSRHSCECHQMGSPIADILAAAAAQGVADMGISDHLHSRYNLPDLAASRLEFLSANPSPRVHFGVEVTCMRRWELDQIDAGNYAEPPIYGRGQDGPVSEPAIALTEADAAILGIEYVIGGVHWARGIEPTPRAIIDFFHRQLMYLAQHPLVRIIAHPWWWHNHFYYPDGSFVPGPWMDDFSVIPEDYHDEFAATCLDNGKAVEVSPWALSPSHGETFRNQYLDYLVELGSRGITLSAGTDHHGNPYNTNFSAIEMVLDRLRLSDRDLFRLRPRDHALGVPAERLLAALDLRSDDLWTHHPAN
ncbi:MAG: hypothetical protein ABFD92_11380 [Planctomycetaceae bacterium]|nr:hypothetical protein [Planctomycetaceae bacterium]